MSLFLFVHQLPVISSFNYVLLCNKVTDCGVPLEDSQVIIEPVNDTILGALITFHCDNTRTAICGSDGEWSPNPALSKEI